MVAMKGFLINDRSSGIIEREREIVPRKSRFRGKYQPESIYGIEKVRQALQLMKEIMKEERDPVMKRQIASAALQLNELLIK